MTAFSHDLIVIGAGPAGSAAGYTAANAGLRVALVDKAAFPRDKLCGGGVTGRSGRYLGEIFGCDPTRPGGAAATRVRLVAGGEVLADIADAPPIKMVMRRDFDAALFELAGRAGCDLRAGQRPAELDPLCGRAVLSDGSEVTAPVMIGADGAMSAVAKALFGRAFDPERVGFGLEAEVPDEGGAGAGTVEIDLLAAGWGYGWAFPKAGTTTVGVGGLYACNPNLRVQLDGYLERRGVDPAGVKVRGAFLPFGEVRPVPGRGRALLVGDAAGLVDPITGEGIAWALKSGQLAGRAVIDALRAGAPEAALAGYRRALRPVQAELRRARFLRWFFYQKHLQPAFLRFLAREPGLQRRYLALLSGDADYADLSWRAMPRLAFKVARRLAA